MASGWLSARRKKQLAKVLGFGPVHRLLQVAVKLWVPRYRVGVSTVVLDERGRVLLLYHVFRPHNPWGLPGGWLNPNENPSDCARRELHEETGLDVTLGPLIYAAMNQRPRQLELIFLARWAGAEATVPLSDEIIEMAWFAPEALPSPLTTHTIAAIAAACPNLPTPKG